MKEMNKLFVFLFFLVFLIFLIFLFPFTSFSQEITETAKQIQETAGVTKDLMPDPVGEFFGIPVSLGNYYFAKRVVYTFNAKWRPIPQNDQELEDLTWQELILSFEAFRRGIQVDAQERENEIDKILADEKVTFDRNKDKAAYQQWVKEKLDEPSEVFINQVEHLLKLKKLHQQVIDSIEPQVTDQEAYNKFLDEYNTLALELFQFDDTDQASTFYKDITENPGVWDEKAQKEPKELKKPGFVALDFLINMWGLKREDVYAMLEAKPGEFYSPAPIYKGYGVFKIIQIRKAEEKDYQDRKDYYVSKIKTIKKYQGFKDWLKNIKDSCDLKIFIAK
jgi:hypothetical protein